MGTPQLRWRETHQSGRLFIIASSRARPQAGKNSVFLDGAHGIAGFLLPWAGEGWGEGNC
jgi:hypothetical protein